MVLALGLALAACGDGAMAFDTAAWASERGNYDKASARAGMVGQLGAAGMVAGASRAHVRATLGEPDGEGPARDTYFLGRGSYAPDYETLVVNYDPAGTVISVVRQQS